MYVLISDCTNDKAGIYNALYVANTFDELSDAIDAANEIAKDFREFADLTYDPKDIHPVDTAWYDDCTGAEIEPYPEYVIGEAVGNGEYYHIYYMVVKAWGDLNV